MLISCFWVFAFSNWKSIRNTGKGKPIDSIDRSVVSAAIINQMQLLIMEKTNVTHWSHGWQPTHRTFILLWWLHSLWMFASERRAMGAQCALDGHTKSITAQQVKQMKYTRKKWFQTKCIRLECNKLFQRKCKRFASKQICVGINGQSPHSSQTRIMVLCRTDGDGRFNCARRNAP